MALLEVVVVGGVLDVVVGGGGVIKMMITQQSTHHLLRRISATVSATRPQGGWLRLLTSGRCRPHAVAF